MVDMSKMRKDYDKHQRGGDWFVPQIGDTLLYIHGQCRPNDKYEPTEGLNYVEVGVHYRLGGNTMAVSFDKSANPIITHPFVTKLLKKKKIKVPGRCPIKKYLENADITDSDADESRFQTKFLFGVTPIKHRLSKTDDWKTLPPQPAVYMAGRTIYDGIMDAFLDCGDITDMDGAIYMLVNRKGKGRNDTKYTVTVYSEKGQPGSAAKPVKIKGKLKAAIIRAMEPEGDCDLFKIVANLAKSPEDLAKVLSGPELTDDDADDDLDDDDLDGDDLDDDDSDDDDSDDDDLDDDDGDSDDDDSDDDDDDSDDDDSDDDDSDDEPAPKSKPKKTVDDDASLDELDAELDRLSKAGKTKAGKAKAGKAKAGKVKTGKAGKK